MKRLLPVILAALLAAACGATATPKPSVGPSVPWGASERSELNIERGGKIEGTIVFIIVAKDGGYVFTTETVLGPVKDVSQVRVDGDLRPVGSTRELTGAGAADFALLSVYDKGKLSIEAKTAEGQKAASISVPADVWDNDQSLMSARALPLRADYSHTRAIVVPASATVVQTGYKVVATEKVDVPAGSYNSYKVELDFGSGKHYAWYDVNAPHHLVKYENTGVQRVFVLTKVGTP